MGDIINALEDRDIKLLYAVNHGIKCRILDKIMPYITHLGSAGFTVGLPIVMILFKKEGLRLLGIEILIALTTSHLLVQIIKRTVNRPRPWIALENVNSFGIPLYCYSLPSGHTTAAFSTAIVIALNIPVLFCIVTLLAVAVGISRMYLGVHYPSDVLVGCIIGTTFAVISHIFIAK